MESSWTKLIKRVSGKNFSLKKVKELFKKVDKEDYAKGEREDLINYVFSLTNQGLNKAK